MRLGNLRFSVGRFAFWWDTVGEGLDSQTERGVRDFQWFFMDLSRRAACRGAAQRGSPETQRFPHGLFVPACYTLMATYFFQLIEEVCRFSAREELLPLSKQPQAGRVDPHQCVRMTRVNTFLQDIPPSSSHPFLDPTIYVWILKILFQFSCSTHTCPSFASPCKDLENMILRRLLGSLLLTNMRCGRCDFAPHCCPCPLSSPLCYHACFSIPEGLHFPALLQRFPSSFSGVSQSPFPHDFLKATHFLGASNIEDSDFFRSRL